MKGVTGHNMLILLERRLDNVVYRMGMAASPSASPTARQPRTHPSQRTQGYDPQCDGTPGDSVSVKDKKSTEMLMRRLMSENSSRQVSPWIEVSQDDLTGKVTMLPTREMIPTIAEEQLIVEFYSK
jgi:small subunit ribosomal protein S4